MIKKKSKIFVAGHKGMVGAAIIRKLKVRGFSNIITRDKKKLDLLDQSKVFKFLRKEARNGNYCCKSWRNTC